MSSGYTPDPEMLKIIENIPDIEMHPLNYVMQTMHLQHKPDTLWLEFGVYKGDSINYISAFTQDKVYGFDSFYGLPETWREGYETGTFSLNGVLPELYNVNNVELVKGLFSETLHSFIANQNKKVSFIHFDADLYSSTKYVLDILKTHLDTDCVIIFDELVNYPGFDGATGELRAFYEFVTENNVNYEWIGMNGPPFNKSDSYEFQNVGVTIHSVV